jgi:hypothetical protein
MLAIATVAEALMKFRLATLLVLAILLSPAAFAKDKNKSTLPEYVLRARTVAVMVDPDAGEPLDTPYANATARDNVETALRNWGRFDLVMDARTADLIVSVRTGNGRAMRPAIKGGPGDQRTGAWPNDGGIRVGSPQSQAPPYNDPTASPNRGPHVSNDVGSPDDMFAVYRGGVDRPLDTSPVWRYSAKNCLGAPNVPAVEEFRKAIAAAEQARPAKKP